MDQAENRRRSNAMTMLSARHRTKAQLLREISDKLLAEAIEAERMADWQESMALDLPRGVE